MAEQVQPCPACGGDVTPMPIPQEVISVGGRAARFQLCPCGVVVMFRAAAPWERWYATEWRSPEIDWRPLPDRVAYYALLGEVVKAPPTN